MRIAFLTHAADLGGAEVALARLVRGLQGRAECTVIIGEDGPLVDEVTRSGARAEIVPLPASLRQVRREGRIARPAAVLGANTEVVRSTARVLRRIDPDVVQTTSNKSHLYGGLAARLVRRPCLWWVHDRFSADLLAPSTARLMRAAAAVLPSRVVANSQATRATLGRAGRTAGVIYPPVGPSVQRAVGSSGAVVGMAGRLVPWKGQDRALRAFALVADVVPSARLRICGSAMYADEGFGRDLVTLASALELGDRVDFLGHVLDMPGERQGWDVALHLSVVPEPFGLVVAEAMAAGLPVVASNRGGPAELVTPGVDGVLVDPDDVAEVAAALVGLLSDPARRHRFGSAGVRRAASLTEVSVAGQFLGEYTSVLGRSGGSAGAGRGVSRAGG